MLTSTGVAVTVEVELKQPLPQLFRRCKLAIASASAVVPSFPLVPALQ